MEFDDGDNRLNPVFRARGDAIFTVDYKKINERFYPLRKFTKV